MAAREPMNDEDLLSILRKRLEGQATLRTSSGCLLWRGRLRSDGYAEFEIHRRKWLVHRAAWAVANGQIPRGLCVCHTCDTPACIEPSHLFLGTQADNMADMARKGRANAKAALEVQRAAGFAMRPKGEAHGRAKLSESDVAAIRSMNGRQVDIAERFGVSQTLVSKIRLGHLWGHIHA